MLYELTEQHQETSLFRAFAGLRPFLAEEKKPLGLAVAAIFANSFATLLAPIVISRTVDDVILTRNGHGLWSAGGILLSLYLIALGASYTISNKPLNTVLVSNRIPEAVSSPQDPLTSA